MRKLCRFSRSRFKWRSELADLHPSVTRFREKLGVSYREIAELEHKVHQDTKAFQSIQRAIDVFGPLVRSQPEQPSFHADLGLSWNYQGILYDDARNNAEATRSFQNAVLEQRAAIRVTKSPDDYKVNLANHLDNLGEQYVDLGRPTEGLPHYEEALRAAPRLVQAHPEKWYTDELVKALIVLGNINRHLGEAASARELFAEARTALAKRLALTPGDRDLEIRLAAALDSEAAALEDLLQPETARPLLEQAAERLRKVCGSGAPEAVLALARERLSETLWDLARVLRDLEPPLDSEPVTKERIDLWKARPPEELVELALKHLNQATVIGFGKPT